MVPEGGVGVLAALNKGENCQGNINRFGVFLAAVLSGQSSVPTAGGDTAVEPLCS